MDRQVRLRLVLYASILTLFVLAATQGDEAGTFQAAILIPIAFIAGGVFLLGLPFLAMEHAEGGHVPWKKALDFVQHSAILAFLDVMLLWTTGFVTWLGSSGMNGPARAAFWVAVAVGSVAALMDWALSQQPDRKQRRWQKHPDA